MTLEEKQPQPTTGDRLPKTLRRLLALLREHMDMEVAHISRFHEGDQHFEIVEGDGDGFGFEEGGAIPLDASYCKRMVLGALPNVVNDAPKEPRLDGIEATKAARIGAYIGVPITYSNGRIYGTLCCLSHESRPELGPRDVALMNTIAGLIADHIEREELQARTWKMQLETAALSALSAALEARDGYTGEHSDAVLDLCNQVAEALGFGEGERYLLRQAALLHDIGKIGVPDAVLRKPGPLDDEEWTLMKQHPVIGARIVETIPGLQRLTPILRAEHERWDGQGYPDGLVGEQIPMASRIVLTCDAYHAMISDRPYRAALGTDVAIQELRNNSGSQFDPTVVDALIACVISAPAV